MRKFRWGLSKTLEFLNSRRPEMEMRGSFLNQLQMYEGRLIARGLGPKSHRWNEVSDRQTYHLDNDEVILRNTYVNSLTGPMQPTPEENCKQRTERLVWRDISTNNDKHLCEENQDKDDLVNLVNPAKQMNHYTKCNSNLQSKLKGSKLNQQQRQTRSVTPNQQPQTNNVTPGASAQDRSASARPLP